MATVRIQAAETDIQTTVSVKEIRPNVFTVESSVINREFSLGKTSTTGLVEFNTSTGSGFIWREQDNKIGVSFNDDTFFFAVRECHSDADSETQDTAVPSEIESQLSGVIIEICKKAGSNIRKGETVMIIEAMKMQNSVVAPCDATIKTISVEVGATVSAGETLFALRQDQVE